MRTRWLESITNSMEMNLSQLQEIVKDREDWYAQAHGVTIDSDGTTTAGKLSVFCFCFFL